MNVQRNQTDPNQHIPIQQVQIPTAEPISSFDPGSFQVGEPASQFNPYPAIQQTQSQPQPLPQSQAQSQPKPMPQASVPTYTQVEPQPRVVAVRQQTYYEISSYQNRMVQNPQDVIVVVNPDSLGPGSVGHGNKYCQKCKTTRPYIVTYGVGIGTWIWFVVLLFVFWPLAFLPFCLASCQDIVFVCGVCGHTIERKKLCC